MYFYTTNGLEFYFWKRVGTPYNIQLHSRSPNQLLPKPREKGQIACIAKGDECCSWLIIWKEEFNGASFRDFRRKGVFYKLAELLFVSPLVAACVCVCVCVYVDKCIDVPPRIVIGINWYDTNGRVMSRNSMSRVAHGATGV